MVLKKGSFVSRIIVAALYKFADLPDYKTMQPGLLELCIKHGLKGTLLLAEEGINGTVAGSRAGIDALMAYLHADPRFAGIEHKESTADTMPFYRMKVRLKKEIVTLGVQGINPNKKVGTYVAPEDWNALIADPDVIVVDTRNDYEYGIGTFKGAVDPQTKTFREFPQYVKNNLDPARHKKVAMFCTGGILKYLEKVPATESLWQGECFVFDQRVAVGHGLELGNHELCHACRHPVSPDDKKSEQYLEGVACPNCYHSLSDAQRASASERQKQMELATKRGIAHIGAAQPKRSNKPG